MMRRPPRPPPFPSTTLFRSRMEFSEAKALITTNHARRKGKAAEIKSEVDKFLDDVPSIETVIVVRNTDDDAPMRSEEHTSELQSANISYAVFCLKKKNSMTC